MVKMIANYAEICSKVGNLEADFQQVNKLRLFNYSETFTILLWNISNSNSNFENKRQKQKRQMFFNKI